MYLIKYKACAIQYVGHTTRGLRDRLHNHIYNLEKEHGTNAARHFNETHGGDVTLLQIQGIEKVTTPRRGDDSFRILFKWEVFFLYSNRFQFRVEPD